MSQYFDLMEQVDTLKANTQEFVLWPRQWRTYSDSHAWSEVKLRRPDANQVPNRSGIYTLILEPGIAGHHSCAYLMYVGQATSLRARFRDYLGKERNQTTGRPRMVYFLRKYSRFIWFCYTEIDVLQLDSTEKKLYSAYIPPLNRDYEGELGRVVGAFA